MGRREKTTIRMKGKIFKKVKNPKGYKFKDAFQPRRKNYTVVEFRKKKK